MKHHRLLAAVALLNIFCLTAMAKDLTARLGTWDVIYNQTSHTFSFQRGGRNILSSSKPEASLQIGETESLISTADFDKVALRESKDATTACFSFTGRKTGETGMDLVFCTQGDALLARLTLCSKGIVGSNYMAPIATVAPNRFDGQECRILKVPFDNDGFGRYLFCRLDTAVTSYEVCAIFDGMTRHGLVVGSVEHDHWKSAVQVDAEQGNVIKSLKAFSGVSTEETRDVLPHGSLQGSRVSSARFLLAEADDWRDGMELFASACTMRQPGRRTWDGGTPFGWQSWGVMATKNNLKVDMATADYLAYILRPAGFAGSDGMQIMSIDAWDNLNAEQKLQLTAHCSKQGQMVGLYRSPFCLWWGEHDNLERPLYNGCKYSASECVLTAKGQPLRYDGAFCLDPTHPAVKDMISRDMEEARRLGFRYVKADFLCNGCIQADKYYDKEVRTAVEAYNAGMKHFMEQCRLDDGSEMFIALSISPIFPYQYANSRRIACDTWGKISHSEYAMNAIGGGWWTNGLYQRNDPDHIVLVGNDKEKETEGENRARLTTGIASGMLLLADNYDITDDETGCGNPSLSIDRAMLLLQNAEVNALARRIKTSFRPVYGFLPYNGKPGGADNFMVYRDRTDIVIAIVNYDIKSINGKLDLKDIGLTKAQSIRELWTGTNIPLEGNMLPYSVPAWDARLYKVEE